MASTVHYKFKSQKDYDSIGFDGMFISVGDLKRQITERRGLGSDRSMDLVLTNAQNDEEYADDATMVWKNTSVIVKRVPVVRLDKVGSEAGSDTQKKKVYVAPPEPLPSMPRPPKRPYPSAHAGSMTWTADQGASAPAESADASIAALVNNASQAWESGEARSHGGEGRPRRWPRRRRPRRQGRSRRTRRRGHRSSPTRIRLLPMQHPGTLDPPVPDERRRQR